MEFGRPDGRESGTADNRETPDGRDGVEFHMPYGLFSESLLRGGLKESLEADDDEDEDDDAPDGKKKHRRSRSLLPLIQSSTDDAPLLRNLFSLEGGHSKEALTSNSTVGNPEDTFSIPSMAVGNQAENASGVEDLFNAGEVLPESALTDIPPIEVPAGLTSTELNKIRTFVHKDILQEEPAAESSDTRQGTAENEIYVGSLSPEHIISSAPEAEKGEDMYKVGEYEAGIPGLTPLERYRPVHRTTEVAGVSSPGLLAAIGVEAGFRYLGDRKSRRLAREDDAKLRRKVDQAAKSLDDVRAKMLANERHNMKAERRTDEFERRAVRALERQSIPQDITMVRRESLVKKQEPQGRVASRLPGLPPTVADAGPYELRKDSSITEAQPMPITASETDKLVEARVNPKAVMEQVSIAAEQDVPVERVYERRQEIKDDPSAVASSGSGGASRVNVATSASQSLRSQQSTQSIFDTSHNITPVNSQYRGAAKNGVAAALVIIIVLFMAYLLLH